jgi:hypothetical protein
MPRKLLRPALLAASGLLLLCGSARADGPSIAECLASSDASLKLGREHRLQEERVQLLVCASNACPDAIRNECIRRVDEVNAAIPTLIFEAKDAAGNDLSAVKVTMDGQVLVQSLDGTALSIDPGHHTFVLETQGQPPVQKELVLREAQKDRRETLSFGLPAAPPSTSQPLARPEPVPAPPPPSSEHGGGLGTQKILALVAGGIGVVGLGVGAAFGLVAVSKKSTAQSECPNLCATPDGVSKWSDAVSAANGATVGFVIGGVGLAGAAALWFTAPRVGTSTQVDLGLGALQVNGSW